MKPNLLKLLAHSKTLVFVFFGLFFSLQIFAQVPVNDNCGAATTLTSAITCTNTAGTLINATKSALVTFGTPGANSWTCPAGVTSVTVECWGAGGAGGGSQVANVGGGGGGGGAYTISTIPVIPGITYSISVGAGMAGTALAGVAGTASSFNITSVVANGGAGGAAAAAGIPGAGGLRGAAGTFAGGNGASGTGTVSSGAGGGGAGSGGAGGNASGITAGVGGAIDGGAGGAGVTGNVPGIAGAVYGAGGSGGRTTTSLTARFGGKGADGFVRLTYGICGNANSPDVWYKFVAQTTYPTITLSSIGANLNTAGARIQLFDACGGAVLGCSTNPFIVSATYPTGLIVGNTYYIQVTTNTNFGPVSAGSFGFNICVTDPPFEYSKSYTNITDRLVGGTVNIGDTLEIRTTIVVKPGTPGGVFNLAFFDTLKAGKGFAYVSNSLSTRTNEGKVYNSFTDSNVDTDAGWFQSAGAGTDTTIQINMGDGATKTVKDTLFSSSLPQFNSNCIIIATYRVRVNKAYGTKINFGGGAIEYSLTAAGVINKIPFPSDTLIVYESLGSCPDATSPTNVVGSEFNGTFGAPPTGTAAAGTQNRAAPVASTSYIKTNLAANSPQDYLYSVANNTSGSNSIIQTIPKPSGNSDRVFGVFDITGDHTGATNTAKGNKPCDPTQVVSATNPCGYMLVINASYKPDVVFDYNVTGGCGNTYYEISAWFKNVCSKCGTDFMGRGPTSPGYIPVATGDSSGVRPNLAMKINGINYYTTGDIVYKGIGGTQTGSDTLNDWVRRSFVFKTDSLQTSFRVTFVNNAPGGGGNDWVIDDIGIRTCYPTMIYAPPNPIVYMGSPLTITDTVRSYYDSYKYYKWQVKPVSGSWTDIPGFSGTANPIPIGGNYEYVQSYTIPGTATLAANAGDLYRMVVATSLANLTNGCNYTPDISFTLLPADAPCVFSTTNYAIAPQTGSINWNKLNWSLGHIPTCCESAHITFTGTNPGPGGVIIDITNDICIINLTLENLASTGGAKTFKTILDTSYSMQMNGYVNMRALAQLTSDSCIFIAKGRGTITVNGNTTVGNPGDNAHSIFGSAPGTSTYANYMLKGDSLTFNAKGLTTHKFTAITLNPTSGSAKLVNNTSVSPFPNAVTFDILKIGNTTAKTVTTGGSNQNAFMNDNNGYLEVAAGSTLIMPANYSINAKDFVSPGTYKSEAYLRANSTLQLGGISGGITGSNFPANFSGYTLEPTSTVIFNGVAQTIPGVANNVNAYGNITLTGTGVKTGSASNVNLAGNLYRTNGGHTFNANSGRFTFTSSINGQRYYADAGATPLNFYDLTNNNTHTLGLSIDSTFGILNEWELKPSTKTILNTGDIIMRSSATRTSYVKNLGAVIPSIVYNGSYRFVIERYLAAEKAWRFLAAPVQLQATDATTPTVAAAWREGVSGLSSTGYGTAITGPSGPNAQLDYYSQRGSMKYYNSASNVWTELSNTTTTKIANTQGYMVFVRGDRGASNVTTGLGTATNLRIKGMVRAGDQVFAVPALKFESFGNPYASQIDFRTVTKTNIVNAFTVWNPAAAGLYNVGAYETYVWNGTNYVRGATIRNYIESGEAVFVQSNSATAGSITVKESDKGTGSALVSRVGVTRPTLEVNMYSKDANGTDYLADGVMLNFDNNFSAGIDNMDVRKINNTYDNLAIKNGSYALVVERRPNLVQTDTIKLSIVGMRVATYRLEIDPSVLVYPGLEAILKDKYLQTETSISFNAVTTQSFDITTDAASKVADRFMIVFKPAATTNFTTIAATRNADKTITVNWGVQNETAVANYSVEQSNDGINFTAIATKAATANNGTNPTYSLLDATASKAANWYRVKANNTNNTVKYTAVAMVAEVQETIQIAEAKMSIYPNPVVDGNVNLHLDNQTRGNYSVQITNAAGQQVKAENVQVENNNTLRIIKLGSIATGKYQAMVKDEQGNKTTIGFMIK
jgi:Secretion system C-terminal sorting domain